MRRGEEKGDGHTGPCDHEDREGTNAFISQGPQAAPRSRRATRKGSSRRGRGGSRALPTDTLCSLGLGLKAKERGRPEFELPASRTVGERISVVSSHPVRGGLSRRP